jgi:hypothetical protein
MASYELDARQIPANWTTGYWLQGSDAPGETTTDIYGTEVFEVRPRGLVSQSQAELDSSIPTSVMPLSGTPAVSSSTTLPWLLNTGMSRSHVLTEVVGSLHMRVGSHRGKAASDMTEPNTTMHPPTSRLPSSTATSRPLTLTLPATS